MTKTSSRYSDVAFSTRPSGQTSGPPFEEHDGSLDVWRIVDPLLERKWLLLIVPLAVAIVVGAATRLLLPKTYGAEATLFVAPPTFATTLRPSALSVEAYARLAESEFILTRVDEQLLKERPDLFSVNTGTTHLAGFSAALSASREPQKPYLPLVRLTAESDSPEKAKVAANAWADVFVREEAEISKAGKDGTADFILTEYPKMERALTNSETALQQREEQHSRESAALQTEVGVTLRQTHLESLEATIVYLEGLLAGAHSDRDRLKPSVASLEEELTKTPPHVLLRKALSDDVILAGKPGTRPDPLAGATLETQETNPVYTMLSERLARERVELNAVEPRMAALKTQITDLRKQAASARAALFDGERRLADMKRKHESDVAGLRRTVESSKQSVARLSEKIGEAEISKSEPNSDLKLAAYAELPKAASGPHLIVNVLVAAVVAFGLTAIYILALGAFRVHHAVERRA